ncbi:MAG: LuxR C-terminal-related transcriptional regulator [Oligoflexus sp.]
MGDKLVSIVQSFAERHGFSKRESSVFLGLVGYGTKHSDLARELDISPNTLRIHLRNMNQKAGTAGISSLLRSFIEYSFSEKQRNELPRKAESAESVRTSAC